MTPACDFELARQNMVLQQIRPWEVIDERVLGVIQSVPRERFVPENYQSLAFADIEIPLAHGCAMMAPRVEARMLQALNVKPGDRVLEVGTGSGFVTACLARLGGRVSSIDIHADFVATATHRLADLGIATESLQADDIFSKDFADSRFDVIALTGSLPRYDERFESLLTTGGRLFAIVGQPPVMKVLLVRRVNDQACRRDGLFETSIAPLQNAPTPEKFVF